MCPDGYVSVVEPEDLVVVSDSNVCPDGYTAVVESNLCDDGCSDCVCYVIEQMCALCGGGFSQIKTSGGLVVSLYAERATTPSFCVRYNDTVWFAELVEGNAEGTINVRYNNTVNHLE